MSFLRRRSATPAGPDFDVLAMDPGDWPGNLGAGLLPAPDGTCQGVFLRYDLFGGRGPAMIIGNLPEGSPAREVAEDEARMVGGTVVDDQKLGRAKRPEDRDADPPGERHRQPLDEEDDRFGPSDRQAVHSAVTPASLRELTR